MTEKVLDNGETIKDMPKQSCKSSSKKKEEEEDPNNQVLII